MASATSAAIRGYALPRSILRCPPESLSQDIYQYSGAVGKGNATIGYASKNLDPDMPDSTSHIPG